MGRRDTGLSFTLSGLHNPNLWQIRHNPNMKHKPQTLTPKTIAVVVAVFAVLPAITPAMSVLAALPDETDDSGNATADVSQDAAPPNEKSSAPLLKRSDRTASQVFAEIAEKLDDAEALSCSLRQTILLSGQKFVAAGEYRQSSGNRMRLEYRIFPYSAWRSTDAAAAKLDAKPEDLTKLKETGSLSQVSDGSVLWSYWINGDAKRLSRRNISEILEAAESTADYSTARMLQDLGVGGLQTLTSKLQTGMDFGAVQEQQVGDTKLYVLSGRWNEKTLKDVFKLQEDLTAPLPDYIPDYVRVYVDAGSMLPRRIQYLKRHPDSKQKKVRPLVTLDLRNINLQAKFSNDTFTFTRPDEKDLEETDLTPQVIESLKRMAEAKKAATEAKTTTNGATESDEK